MIAGEARFAGGFLHGRRRYDVVSLYYLAWDADSGRSVRYVRCEPEGSGYVYRVESLVMPNDYTPRPDAFTIMNAHLPASPRVKGDLLFGLANIVGMIEQDEANLAELKANLKKRRQARDEILTQLAELDVVVDGV